MGTTGKEQPVLVAVDFSPDSEAALLWACDYARLAGAPLAVLHVVHDPADAPGFYHRGEFDWSRPMADMAAQLFDTFLADMKARHSDVAALADLRRIQVKGLPASRIVEVAEKEEARLIVTGSRGRTGLPHILLGSVAERVVQTSRKPVTVVKAAAQRETS